MKAKTVTIESYLRERRKYFQQRFSELDGSPDECKASLSFYKRLVEDLTRMLVSEAIYDSGNKALHFTFEAVFAEDLCIIIPADLCNLSTREVIGQTEEYIDDQREMMISALDEEVERLTALVAKYEDERSVRE